MSAFTRGFPLFALGVLSCLLMCAGYIGLRNVRMAEQDEVCYGNLTLLRAALSEYAVPNDGLLPPSLDVLVEKGLLESRCLTCPTSGREYLYVIAQRPTTWNGLAPWDPVVADQGFPHGRSAPEVGRMNCLTGGGTVSSISVRELSEALQQEPDRLAEMIKLLQRYRTKE